MSHLFAALALSTLALSACAARQGGSAQEAQARAYRDYMALPEADRKWHAAWSKQNGPSGQARERLDLALTRLSDKVMSARLERWVPQAGVFATADRDATPLERSTDGRSVGLAARWRAEARGDRAGAASLACAPFKPATTSYLCQLLCGDYTLASDRAAALNRWKSAFSNAQGAAEECAIVERVDTWTPPAEAGLIGLPAKALGRCRAERNRLAKIARKPPATTNNPAANPAAVVHPGSYNPTPPTLRR